LKASQFVTVDPWSREEKNNITQIVVSDIQKQLNSNNKLLSNISVATWSDTDRRTDMHKIALWTFLALGPNFGHAIVLCFSRSLSEEMKYRT
jgi:hypothetical protein